MSTDHVSEIRAKADEIERDSQRWRTRQPWAYHFSRRLVRFLRWRAADVERYATPAGRRRSARRWAIVAVAVSTLGVADRIAYHLWHWQDWSVPIQFVAFLALGVSVKAGGWADGYEARQREDR